MKNYQYLPLDKQAEKLIEILLMSRSINSILETAHTLDLPNWYLGAGCIPQTVWNYLTGKKLEDSISDYDLVYYDGSDLSKEKEEERLEETRDLLEYQGIKIDTVNEARVQLWYEKDYGNKIEQYNCVEDAISSWPTTATSVGITVSEGIFSVYAPFGLHDLFGMIVKANKRQVTREIYQRKCKKWKKKWDSLRIIDWSDS